MRHLDVHNPTVGITERGDAALDTTWQGADVDIFVLVTKAPHLLPKDLPEHTIIHCTITGYGGTWLEPHVAPVSRTIPVYRRLVEQFGRRRVVLRVDPIVPQGEWWGKSLDVVGQAEGRIRISFIDAYDHARWRVQMSGHEVSEIFPWDGFHAPLEVRDRRLREIELRVGHDSVEVCGEPGMSCTGCVSAADVLAVGFDCPLIVPSRLGRRQRPSCACVLTKRELLIKRKPRPCPHGCLYCYWRDW